MENRYKAMIDAMYGDSKEFMAESEVKYRDGRRGKTVTAVQIISLE